MSDLETQKYRTLLQDNNQNIFAIKIEKILIILAILRLNDIISENFLCDIDLQKKKFEYLIKI